MRQGCGAGQLAKNAVSLRDGPILEAHDAVFYTKTAERIGLLLSPQDGGGRRGGRVEAAVSAAAGSDSRFGHKHSRWFHSCILTSKFIQSV